MCDILGVLAKMPGALLDFLVKMVRADLLCKQVNWRKKGFSLRLTRSSYSIHHTSSSNVVEVVSKNRDFTPSARKDIQILDRGHRHGDLDRGGSRDAMSTSILGSLHL